MKVKQIVEAYADELENWDFFSDGQRAYIDSNKHIIVCLRNYNWYGTKYPIKTQLLNYAERRKNDRRLYTTGRK